MVTSTSTPGSREMEVICLTISDDELRSMSRLWIFISNRSQVLDPSPQGLEANETPPESALARFSRWVVR
jgi:hypothetical protein